ncbi:MAG: ECF transporter S component [Lachnospiraceae bacterium]|nr:ECF transporter S component [Lachnospiraceae bacterium]
MSQSNFPIKKLVLTAMFGAMAFILMYFEFPLPFIAPEFYKLDFSEVPVLIGTFTMGPVAGVFIELIKILLKLLFKGTNTAYIGDLANFLIGCALLVPAGLIYQHKKTKQTAIVGMAVGTVVMALAGCALNALVLLPWYAENFFGGMEPIIAAGAAVRASITDVWSFAVLAVVPFNLIKGVLTSILTFLLYKRIGRVIKRF